MLGLVTAVCRWRWFVTGAGTDCCETGTWSNVRLEMWGSYDCCWTSAGVGILVWETEIVKNWGWYEMRSRGAKKIWRGGGVSDQS